MNSTVYDSIGCTRSWFPARRTPLPMPALVDAGVRTWVDVDTTDYDHRDADDGGCDPDGCVPENTRDGSRAANSRWSCQGDGCCITYSFEEPQDIVRMRIAFHKGNERIRTLNVYDNGHHHSEITSSGETSGFENFSLNTDETEDIKLCLDDDGDDWLSITEVRSYKMRCNKRFESPVHNRCMPIKKGGNPDCVSC